MPRKEVIHKDVLIDDAGMLPIQSPKLVVHQPNIFQLRPLLMHCQREPETAV